MWLTPSPPSPSDAYSAKLCVYDLLTATVTSYVDVTHPDASVSVLISFVVMLVGLYADSFDLLIFPLKVILSTFFAAPLTFIGNHPT